MKLIKSMIRLLVAAALAAAAGPVASTVSAQTAVVTWWVNALTNLPPPNPFTNNTANPNVIVTPLVKGPGIGEPTGTAEYGGNTWTNAGVADGEASSIANGLYLTYAIQAAPGYTVSFTTNILYYHVSATGPANGELQYSTNGVTYTDVIPMTYGPGGVAETMFLTNNLSGVAALQNVPATVTNYFRIVNWGATSSGGTWYIYDIPTADYAADGTNGFTVLGAVTPVPQTVATWWVNAQTNLPPPNPFTNNTAAAGVIVTPMTKGPGIGEPTGTAEYGGNTWTNAGFADSEANSIANGLYLTYAIQAAPGYTLSFATNILYYHVSATGPANGELQYSTNGFTYTDILPMTYGPGGAAETTFMTNNLSGIAALQNVPSTTTNFFRIVNWGATGTGGTWYIYDIPTADYAADGTNGFTIIGGLYAINGAAGVVVRPPTNVVVTPASLTAYAGGSASFSVSQSGSAASNFWYQVVATTPVLIPGATSSSLTLSNLSGANSGNYFVVLTSAAGSATSALVSLTVVDPNIQVEPSSAVGLLNGMVQFGVTAAGTAPLSYLWYLSDSSGDLLGPVSNGVQGDGTIVSGAASSTLTITNLQASSALNNYVVVVSDFYGSATSSVASLLSVETSQAVLALWDFDGPQFTNTAVYPNSILTPAPFIGFGTAAAVGTCYDPGTSPFSGATDPSDVAGVFFPYGFDEPAPNFSWGTENYPAVTGTNKANGVQFNVSTVGAKNIFVSYDSRVSATASDYERLQYTTNGTTWIDYPASSSFESLYGSGNAGYYNFSYNLVGFPGVANNPNFGVRVVTEWQSTATYGIGATNFWVGTDNSYASGAAGNAAAGTVTYDIVAVTGDAITNNNVPPSLGAIANTNMIDTNTLTLTFAAVGGTTSPDQLSYSAQVVPQVSANPSAAPNTINPSFTFGGSGTNRTVTISFAGNPIPDADDAGPILVTAMDAAGDSSATWFVLTVGSINQPPTNSLTALTATNVLANHTLAIPFTVGSARNPSTNFSFTVTSDNNAVIPVGNVVIGGNTNSGNLTLTVTPAANQVGNAKITVAVNDNDPQEPRITSATIETMVRPNASVILVDDFNYDQSGSLDTVAAGLWDHLSGVNGQLQVQAGYAVVNTTGNTENLQAALLGSPYKTNSAAVLYASFIVNMNPSYLPLANGSYFTVFNDGSGNTADVECHLVAATNNAAPGFYRLGINNLAGATGANSVMVPQDLTPGVNYTVIISLVLSNGFSTLWVNPTNQASFSVTDTTAVSPANLYNISEFELRESGASSGEINVGNLAVGTAFNDVFYPAQANPVAYSVPENTTSLFSPLTNDAGSDLSITNVSTDTNAVATVSGTNVVFVPATNFVGVSTLGYTITDDLGNTSSSTITVTVTNVVSLTPIPVTAAYSSAGGGSLVVSWANPAFSLQTTTNLATPWSTIPDATSPYTNLIGTNATQFYRLVH